MFQHRSNIEKALSFLKSKSVNVLRSPSDPMQAEERPLRNVNSGRNSFTFYWSKVAATSRTHTDIYLIQEFMLRQMK